MAAALAASATSEVHQLTSCQTGSASVSADLSSNNAKSPTRRFYVGRLFKNPTENLIFTKVSDYEVM